MVTTLSTWVVLVTYSTLKGWCHHPMVTDSDSAVFMAAAVEVIESENIGNVALILIESGNVHQELFAAVRQETNSDTVFPVASMSKWVSTLEVMSFVQTGRIDLDAPVSNYLTRWRLPAGEFDPNKVTARLLLSHMSGLVDGLGFGDYDAGFCLRWKHRC
ncbi:MAG TPA: class A beta-lactamase-related serine hydrolase [Gammaproteobacteria bacterium]|nr:class A beta-lactamase-related serine hydrolase [Gammaproteobacteria bacterium]HIK70613.1 class A beta-lactamase-related serine hydrolase [Pseudomonadales bacterium]